MRFDDQHILSPDERGNVHVVEDLRLGTASAMDIATGQVEAGIALQVKHVLFDRPDQQGITVLVFSQDQAFELLCSLIALFGGEHV